MNRRPHLYFLLRLGFGLAAIAPFTPAFAQGCAAPLDALPALTEKMKGSPFDPAAVQAFYQTGAGVCSWSDAKAGELITRLARATDDGIDPKTLDPSGIAALTPPKNEEAAETRDLLLTDLALRYARIMSLGQIDLAKIETDIDFPRPKPDFAGALNTALLQGDLAGWLNSLPPPNKEYRQLKAMLAHYRALLRAGGWMQLPPLTLKPGQSSPSVVELRQRLMAEDDLQAPAAAHKVDDVTLLALKRFQSRHGLNPDGILGPRSLAALNVPIEARIRQIIVNLDRWRYLSAIVQPTRFEVNTAAGLADLFVDNAPALSMRAIMGTPKNPTPMLASAVSEVIINPTWTVPASIIKHEILPEIRRHPHYLQNNNMRWIEGRLVQAPGPKNSLGHLKFNFPNPFTVYLHDTPATGLFALDERARSHGCVRLELPLDFAERLLKDNADWPREAIEQAISDGKTIHIPLKQKMPLVLAYWTAFVDAEGVYNFRDDIYGRDARAIEALNLPAGDVSTPRATP